MKKFKHNLRFNRFTVALVAMFVCVGAVGLHVAHVLAAHTFIVAHNLLHLGGLATVPLAFGVVEAGEKKSVDDQILASLGGLNKRMEQLEQIQKAVAKNQADYEQVTSVVTAVKAELDAYRKQQVAIKRSASARPDEVSQDCAAYLGGVFLLAGINQGRFNGKSLDAAQAEVKNILGIEAKSALTSTDIPLPTLYSGDIVELVYQYGVARKVGTVFPLGAATIKLPKLTTSPTFSLIASSGTVTEKSPQIGFVTFTAEKFGGLVRLPSEIEEDSVVAMGTFLARYAARQMAQVEDYNFFRSTGADSGQNGAGKGLTQTVVDDTMTYSQAGSTSGGKTKQSDMTLADLRNLRGNTVSGAVLMRASYYMHPTYEAALVAFNTSATVQPYQRGTANTPATLDGFPIVWVPDMPAYSTSASVSLVHVLFGDASYNYLGVRRGFSFDISREAAFTTDEILVRALERFTIGKMATNAVGGLITDAS